MACKIDKKAIAAANPKVDLAEVERTLELYRAIKRTLEPYRAIKASGVLTPKGRRPPKRRHIRSRRTR